MKRSTFFLLFLWIHTFAGIKPSLKPSGRKHTTDARGGIVSTHGEREKKKKRPRLFYPWLARAKRVQINMLSLFKENQLPTV